MYVVHSNHPATVLTALFRCWCCFDCGSICSFGTDQAIHAHHVHRHERSGGVENILQRYFLGATRRRFGTGRIVISWINWVVSITWKAHLAYSAEKTSVQRTQTKRWINSCKYTQMVLSAVVVFEWDLISVDPGNVLVQFLPFRALNSWY